MSLTDQRTSARAARTNTWSSLPQSLPARLAGAGLAVAVGWVHVVDQGGLPGNKEPRYVGVGYWLIELAAIAVAVLLLAPGTGRARGLLADRLRAGWVLAVGVALGPLVGYVLSRGPGLPSYTDDKGAWLEPIGILSLVLEALLAGLALFVLTRPALRPEAAQSRRTS
ncbi:MAG: hypothetical protein LH469_06415 [Frankiaceae bacterium]|nr:hypothetical protein [Frankiaceae bacterium]